MALPSSRSRRYERTVLMRIKRYRNWCVLLNVQTGLAAMRYFDSEKMCYLISTEFEKLLNFITNCEYV